MNCKLKETVLQDSPTETEFAQSFANELRAKFPIFQNSNKIFFDNASTTQKPKAVIDQINSFYLERCSNAGRASYRWSTQNHAEIEKTRVKVAEFISASPDEVVFTQGATDSLNLVATSWGLFNLQDGDEIMVCLEDHKSAVQPWLNLKETLSYFGKQIKIVEISMDSMGDYSFASIRNNLSARTRLIAISHIHHVFGLDMEVQGVREIVKDNVLISLDASQSAAHLNVDSKSLGCDFISFSGHKMFAANGSGVLWIHPRLHSQLRPTRSGGHTTSNQNSIASIFEAGTQNIPAILSLAPAIDFIQKTGLVEIKNYVSDLTFYLLEKLKALPRIEFSRGFAICNCKEGYGIISFKIDGINSQDLAFLLDANDIFVRSGDHCLNKSLQDDDYIRVSLQCYNTKDEIDHFAEVLERTLDEIL